MTLRISDYIAHALPAIAGLEPWRATIEAETILATLMPRLSADYVVSGTVAVHRTATIETGATLKGQVIIGPGAFVSASALLRGGVWLGEGVIVGPACEIKTSFIHPFSKTAHLNFVGDSVIGADVNIEAGAMLANYRNERADKQIQVRIDEKMHATGVDKFGSFLGDHSRIGANAVLAPGTVLPPSSIVRRLELVDHG
jgi:NDP-sugar pyrophosphorylase family protein